MAAILIKNARLVNEGKITESEVLIKNSRFEKIDSVINVSYKTEIIDAAGKLVFPGLIDDQVHFREPGLTHKANIETESRAAIAGGITSYIEMPNTQPQTTTSVLLNKKLQLAKACSHANFGFMLGGTNSNLEEILKVDQNICAGIKLFLGSSTGDMLVDDEPVLEQIFANSPLIISVHCEDENTIKANLKACEIRFGSKIPIAYHPQIRSEAACYKSSSMAVALAKKTGARLHVFHLSTALETSLFEEKVPSEKKQITAEVCIHHLWFSDKDYVEKGTLIKWNPAVKKPEDREGLWEALVGNKIDVIATDHAPHTLDEKNNPYQKAPSGGPMVQHALPALLQQFEKRKIPLTLLAQKMSHNPATLFQIKDRGFIREGYFADMVIVEDKNWRVTPSNILYKCGWSPMEGVTFDRAVSHTFVNGVLRYHKGNFIAAANGKQLTFNR